MSWHHFFFSKEIQPGKAKTIGEENGIVILQDDPSLYADEDLVPFMVNPEVTPDEIEVTVPPVSEPETVRGEEASAAAPPEQEVKTIILSKGQTLRLLALDLFGNREFWVYIYLENREKIHNPNRVPSGTELVLPDRLTYSIDAADPQSVAKAKSLGDEVLEKF